MANLENLLPKTASGDDFSNDWLLSVCNFYGSDINRDRLETQLKIYSHMSHVAVHKVLWAGFPSPINTSGSACFRSENWLEFITTEKAGYLYYFQIFFHLGMKSFCLSPQTSRSESSSSPCSMIYSEDGTDDFLIDVSDFNVPSNE